MDAIRLSPPRRLSLPVSNRWGEGRMSLLDFGDLVRGPLIQELAVAASYHCRRSADPMAPIEGLLAGFGPHTPLTDEELDLLRNVEVTGGYLYQRGWTTDAVATPLRSTVES
jgi:Ser/Thr protein kinase RdoA (MazF antagonist)